MAQMCIHNGAGLTLGVHLMCCDGQMSRGQTVSGSLASSFTSVPQRIKHRLYLNFLVEEKKEAWRSCVTCRAQFSADDVCIFNETAARPSMKKHCYGWLKIRQSTKRKTATQLELMEESKRSTRTHKEVRLAYFKQEGRVDLDDWEFLSHQTSDLNNKTVVQGGRTGLHQHATFFRIVYPPPSQKKKELSSTISLFTRWIQDLEFNPNECQMKLTLLWFFSQLHAVTVQMPETLHGCYHLCRAAWSQNAKTVAEGIRVDARGSWQGGT